MILDLSDMEKTGRTCRKLDTYRKILAELPATFTVLQRRTKLYPSHLTKYLHDLTYLEPSLIKREGNLYRFNDDALDTWMQTPERTPELKAFLAMLFKIPVKFRVKEPHKKEKQIKEMPVGDAFGYKDMFLKKEKKEG